MLESLYAESFIGSVLKSDALLIGATALSAASQIYKNKAREDIEAFPCLIYNIQTPKDFNSQNQERLFTEYLFQVRVVGEVRGIELQNADRVRTAANRMDELLRVIRRVSRTVDGQTFFFNVWRESELPVREEPGETEDIFYQNFGGFYRVQVFN